MLDQFAKLEALALNPANQLLKAASTAKKHARNWPFTGQVEERSLWTLLAIIYSKRGRAQEWAEDWCQEKFQKNTPTGLMVIRYCMFFDTALTYDMQENSINPLDLASAEVIARDLYGIIKAFDRVHTEDDMKPKGQKKSKLNWGARDMYDVAAISRSGFSIPGADRAVNREVRRRAAVTKINNLEQE